MKKLLLVLVALIMTTVSLTSCAKKAEPKALRVVVVINTNLGDKAFSDLVWGGVQKAASEFDLEVKAVELGGDPTKQEPTLTELCESKEWDLIVAGTFNLLEATKKAAEKYPNQKFLVYDAAVDFAGGKFKNVVSVLSKQNEGSYLAGALAALLTQSTTDPLVNAEKIIGFVGGGENAAINDFLIGYIEGAKAVDPATKILFSYVGNFTDSAKAKELTLAQYQQGADIVFAVASSAGFGVYDAAKTADKYAIGVDQDKALQFKAVGDITQAKHIPTSVVKNLDVLIYDKLSQFVKGTMPWGTHEAVGLKGNGMALANNEYTKLVVSADILAQVEALKAKIVAGTTVVPTAIGLTTEQIQVYKDKAGQ